MRGLFWTGLIGFIVSLLALIFCLLLPIINGPRTSWGEAMAGIIPAGVLTLVFLVLFIVGLTATVNRPGDDWERSRRSPRRHDEYDDYYDRGDRRYDDYDDDRPRR